MRRPVRFIFALHNHQPIGNFENVFEQTYQESYLPFLDVFEQYPQVRLALHTSGSLMEWMDQKHPEYVDRLAELVAKNQVEIIGGPFYEPILAMLPSRDRMGQIRKYTRWLQNRLGCKVRGLWVPERVWEQSFVRDLADAGMEYTILDDCHFKDASLEESQLTRHYITEDDGRTMSVFPGSEKLRYLIPFRDVNEMIRHFEQISEQCENAVLTHGDDGEKFGSWPGTACHVYGEGWLHQFFQALTDNADWLITTTPSQVMDTFKPLGKIYLPDGSYREMTEWVLPPERQNELEAIRHAPHDSETLLRMKKFLRGGFWRNFKVRYPESNEMYSRMMQTSHRIQQFIDQGLREPEMEAAHDFLYRGQCNCSYWHGAFGGIYLPHLRNAVYQQMIQADNVLDRLRNSTEPVLEADIRDYNFDGQKEVRLANNAVIAWLAPKSGGTLYELDVRKICHNLGASLTRRQEAYHRKVLAGHQAGNGDCASIHDRVVFKQEGLDRHVRYDQYPRKSLVDLFYGCDVTFEEVRNGTATLYSTFHESEYETSIRRIDASVEVKMSAENTVFGVPVSLEKTLILTENSPELAIVYRLSGLPRDYRFHFAVEMNFAGLPGGAEDRYYSDWAGNRFGHFGTPLDLKQSDGFRMVDEWLGLKLELETSRFTDFYAFPVETVSQSEGGFELVQQSVAVQPHWMVVPDENGHWEVKILMNFDTSLAEARLTDRTDGTDTAEHPVPAPKFQDVFLRST
ncbi:MAG: DUF1926 domain-containing protein [Planctomycetaceae bacterium]|jgi:alpha-amylase|nr:DUF1926 domain-containing protein [Planctomycetaceae bacterium]